MLFKSTLFAISGLTALAQGSPVVRRADATQCLNANAIQSNSALTGQVNDVAAAGQSNSQTDTANFINFCSGQTLTNGLQIKTGSCNGIVMGKIPATTKMVSSVITNPKLNDQIDAETSFNVTVAVANLQLGTFTNATSTYYSAPQDLNSAGAIIGHTHVTVQNVGADFQFTTPLDATQFVFFKGINDAGDGNGLVTTEIKGGLPAGNYRVCTMSSSANHQPVLMPVAQRGAQDDCRYFTVKNNAAAGSGSGTASSASAAASVPATTAATSAAADAATSSVAATKVAASAATTSAASDAAGAATTAASATTAAASAAASSTSGDIGGIAAPVVQDSGNAARPFMVNGDTFVNKFAAVQRACAIQNNKCADACNSGKVPGKTVNDCNAQEVACNAKNA